MIFPNTLSVEKDFLKGINPQWTKGIVSPAKTQYSKSPGVRQ